MLSFSLLLFFSLIVVISIFFYLKKKRVTTFTHRRMVKLVRQQQGVGEEGSVGRGDSWHQQLWPPLTGRGTGLVLPLELIKLLHLVYVLVLEKHRTHCRVWNICSNLHSRRGRAILIFGKILETVSSLSISHKPIITLNAWSKDFLNVSLMVSRMFMFDSASIKASRRWTDLSTCHSLLLISCLLRPTSYLLSLLPPPQPPEHKVRLNCIAYLGWESLLHHNTRKSFKWALRDQFLQFLTIFFQNGDSFWLPLSSDSCILS